MLCRIYALCYLSNPGNLAKVAQIIYDSNLQHILDHADHTKTRDLSAVEDMVLDHEMIYDLCHV